MTDAQIAERAINRDLIAQLLFEAAYPGSKWNVEWRSPSKRKVWIDRAGQFINKLLDSGVQCR